MENTYAARAWHARFPLDEYVPDERVSFQKGRKIEESELKAAGLGWCEVSGRFIYVIWLYGEVYANFYLKGP